MRTSRRGIATSFVVLCMLLGSLSWLSPAGAQETGKPVLSAATATSEPAATETSNPPVIDQPVATDEPAATDEPVATDVPAATDEPLVTATNVPENLTSNDEPDLSTSAVVFALFAYLSQCIPTDSALVGTFDSYFTGEMTAASNAQGCSSLSSSTWTITLTDAGGVNGPYVADFGSGYASFDSTVEEGTYTVTINDGTADHVLDGAIVLQADVVYSLEIVRYIAGTVPEQSDSEVNNGNVQGQVTTCQDPARVGETDFLIANFNTAEVGQCLNPQYGQGGVTLAGVPNNDALEFPPVSVNLNSIGEFNFGYNIPSGRYTVTDVTTGVTSIEFQVGGNAYDYVRVEMVNYYAGDVPLVLPELYVSKYYCGDDARDGDTEFVFETDTNDIGANALLPSGPASTCVIDPNAYSTVVEVTLRATDPNSDFASLTRAINGYGSQASFTPLQPGEYTLSEDDGGNFAVESAPFTLAYGDVTYVTIVNYVAAPDLDPPGEDEGSVYLDGYLNYCTSPERAGTVEFQLDIALQSAETGVSQCRTATAEEGQVVLYFYGNGAAPTADPVTTYNTIGREDTGYYDFGYDDDIAPGWYQLGLRDSAFATQEFRSDIFPLQSVGNGYFNRTWIYAYVDAEPATNVSVEKHICYDPAKVSTTDFFINQFPEDTFDAAATTTCRFITWNDEFDFTFTLTNTATDETQAAIRDDNDAYGFSFQGVPAGTYILTETFGAGTYTAISDEFTVDPAGDPLIVVRNYTDIPFDTEDRAEDASFELWAYTCQNDVFETRYDYYFYPQGFGDNFQGEIGEVTGAAAGATENCLASVLDEYQFQLESVATGTGVTAQATYNLVQDPDNPALFMYEDEAEGLVPAGTYVVRELNTGSVSGQVVIGVSFEGGGEGPIPLNLAEFYYYPAAPTPTATATATATATPTEPGATVTVTPTQGTGWVIPKDPTATATAVPGKDEPGGPVTKLPSTGQGGDTGGSASLYLLLGLALSFLLGAAALTRRTRTSR